MPSSHPPVAPRAASAAGALAESLEERIALAVLTVTNTLDDSNVGSFRRAILDANSLPGPDEIRFDPVVFSTPRVITILSPPTPPQIQGALTITGPGASLLTITRAGARVLESFASMLTITGLTFAGGAGGLRVNGVAPSVTLDSVTFTNNVTTDDGGGVSLTNNSALTLRNCVFANNSARLGGAIYFFQGGSLLMDNCTVSGNSATGFDGHSNSGGGLYFSGTALPTPPAGYVPSTLVVRNSTFEVNTANRGGGGMAVDTLSGTLLVQNVTASGNTAGTSGGGIYADSGPGTITLQNATVTNNTANGTTATTGGGGISRTSITANTLNVVNSIVSINHNTRAPDVHTDAFTASNVNYSAVGSAAGFTLSASSANNFTFGTNPMLGALQYNGGPTRTHALMPGSPMINAGSNARVPPELVYDQRGPGFPRLVGPAVDLGAYERETVAGGVVGRLVFYNHSGFDGNDPAANVADDGAVATDKQPLRPGQTPTFANVTSFAKGINGVMVDILPAVTHQLTAADFTVEVSNANGPTWTAAPAPMSVTARVSPIPELPSRVTLVWPDGAITGRWLRVTVKANANTGLGGPDVFAFGNLVGDTGDSDAPPFRVNALDLGRIKLQLNRASGVTGRVDFNRDGRVNALDLGIAKANLNHTLAAVTAAAAAEPAALPDPASAPATNLAGEATYRRLWDELETPVGLSG